MVIMRRWHNAGQWTYRSRTVLSEAVCTMMTVVLMTYYILQEF